MLQSKVLALLNRHKLLLKGRMGSTFHQNSCVRGHPCHFGRGSQSLLQRLTIYLQIGGTQHAFWTNHEDLNVSLSVSNLNHWGKTELLMGMKIFASNMQHQAMGNLLACHTQMEVRVGDLRHSGSRDTGNLFSFIFQNDRKSKRASLTQMSGTNSINVSTTFLNSPTVYSRFIA
uniref:Uncharacterized protein n=1 Tax=Solanum lycopersicum TaxID=4081 RepID=A0A3Q7IUC9_SOLLC